MRCNLRTRIMAKSKLQEVYTLYWRSVHLIRLVIKSKFSANTVQNMKPIATNSRVHKVPPKIWQIMKQ